MSELLARHQNAFREDPGCDPAFQALEEHYFVSGQWHELATLYRRRASAPRVRADAKQHAALRFRLAQMLEERCDDAPSALEEYLQVAQLQPDHRIALRCARRIYSDRGEWRNALEIGELEQRHLHDATERAALLADLGELCAGPLDNPEQALAYLERSFQLDPQRPDTVETRIRILEQSGSTREVAAAWEQLAELRRGRERAEALVQAAHLCASLADLRPRAAELYRRALTHDPHHPEAVEALTLLAASGQQWHLLADLLERRFELERDPARQAALAAEIGQLQLQCLDAPERARAWLERADALLPDDLGVHYALAKLARHTGDRDRLQALLERIQEIAGPETPARLLVEASELALERDQNERARALLEQAQGKAQGALDLLWDIAHGWLALGLPERAAELLEICTTLTGRDRAQAARCWAELGQIELVHLSDADSAREAYAHAFEIDPAHPDAALQLAELLRKREDWDTLRNLYDRARRCGPESERARFHCSYAELLTEQFDEPEAAKKALELAQALEPTALRPAAALAALARATGDAETWLSAASREAELTPDSARLEVLVHELCDALEARDEPDRALQWVEKLLERLPDRRSALERGVALLARLGDPERELSWIERLLGQIPAAEHAPFERRRGALHASLGHSEAAVEAYERALERDPDDLDVLRALEPLYQSSDSPLALARVLHQLRDRVPVRERARVLSDLATLLEEQLGDAAGAIEALSQLHALESSDGTSAERLADALERAGRHAELLDLLERRAAQLPESSDTRIELELRCARLERDRLERSERAIERLDALCRRNPQCEAAAVELESCLRSGANRAALAGHLMERAEREARPAEAARLWLELAAVREECGELDAARDAYARVLGSESPASDAPESAEVRERARARLEALLERMEAWPALLVHLEQRLEQGPAGERPALLERMSQICASPSALGDPARAAATLARLSELEPQRGDVWQRLVGLYAELGRRDELERAIEAELRCAPPPERECILRTLRADQLEDSGDLEAAAEHWERALGIDPMRRDVARKLASFHADRGSAERAVALLEAQLERLPPSEPGAGDERKSLQLRLAGLRADALGDREGAICVLEAGLAEHDFDPLICDLLHALLEEQGERPGALAALCEQAASCSEDADEQLHWRKRQARALRDAATPRQIAKAVRVYRWVLEHDPADRESERALCALLAGLGETEELIERLSARLAQPEGLLPDESPLELHLALAEHCLAARQPQSALVHYREALKLDPSEPLAYDAALELARELGELDTCTALVNRRLAVETEPAERARLLEHRAALLAGPLDRLDEAVRCYRRALRLDPEREECWRGLRFALESLERWPALLRYLDELAARSEGEPRAALIEEAADVAERRLGPGAALPWLERLHAERPAAPEPIQRLARSHRAAQRPQALLHSLERALERTRDPQEIRALECERADVYEHPLALPACAIPPLERALAAAPDDAPLSDRLEQLYARTGRVRDQLSLIEQRLREVPGQRTQDRIALELRAGQLHCGPLAEPERALAPLLRATAAADPGSDLHLRALASLAEALRGTGRTELWTRAAEEQLRWLPQAARAERIALRRELARIYALRLARPEAALGHLRAALDREREDATTPPPAHDAVETELLVLLRASGDPWELERRLAARLERCQGSAEEWLELAWLRQHTLRAPARARDAYRRALAEGTDARFALRELASVCESLGDWNGVDSALRDLLAAAPDAPKAERVALLRRLGALAIAQLGDVGRALGAYTDALALDPENLESLRALRELRRARHDWREELELCQRELELLGPQGPAPLRQALWLDIARLAESAAAEPTRALDAYPRASELGELEPAHLHRWAEVCRRQGDAERFVEVWERWCDHPQTEPSCEHWMTLIARLEDLGRREFAERRAERASQKFPGEPEPRLALARLRAARGAELEAAEARAAAAECMHGSQAAAHWLEAARAVEQQQPERARSWLARAAERDPASSAICAACARVAERLEHWEEVEEHAARALSLGGAGMPERDGSHTARFQVALAGGRAAERLEHRERAAEFYREALHERPGHSDALERQARVLSELGDLAGARLCLEEIRERGADREPPAAHLELIGRALEAEGELERALEQFRAALTRSADCEAAHRGVVRVLRATQREREAAEACERWARSCPDERTRAEHLLEAARIELDLDARGAALAHLREAVDADPGHAPAQLQLLEELARGAAPDELLERSESALERLPAGSPERGAIAMLRGRALEAGGAHDDAIRVYREARESEGVAAESVLAEARLLARSGRAAEARDALEGFLESGDEHPGPQRDAWLAYGALWADELEDCARATACYERALELDPECAEARLQLARLLRAQRDRWRDAVTHHRALLASNPLQSELLEGLLEIALERGDSAARNLGEALHQALGLRDEPEAPVTAAQASGPAFARRIAEDWPLAPGLPETLREAARVARSALATLPATPTDEPDGAEPAPAEPASAAPLSQRAAARERMREQISACADELSAPGLLSRAPDEIALLMRALACTAHPKESAPESALAQSLVRATSLWMRRKLQRWLGSVHPSQLDGFDFAGWRAELRARAAAQALDQGAGSLSLALSALTDEPVPRRGENARGSGDRLSAVNASPAARLLVSRVVDLWCDQLIAF